MTDKMNHTSVNKEIKDNLNAIKTRIALLKAKKRQEAFKEKQLLEEEYNRELQRKQYKRLMHLLNKSKFYASYIVDKVNVSAEKERKKLLKLGTKKVNDTNKNSPLLTKRRKKMKQSYDIRDYISENTHSKVQQKLQLEKAYDNNESVRNFDDETMVADDTDDRTMVTDSTNDRIEVAKDTIVELPRYLTAELREYQKEGLQWLKILYENGLNGILADEMGLGKTIQVIALLCYLIEKEQSGPFLIIVPLSTITNWEIEFQRFAPKLPVLVFHGPYDVRFALRGRIKGKQKIPGTSYFTHPIVLTTYEVSFLEERFLQKQKWRYIIVDEGQRIKNYKCQLCRFVNSCDSMNRLILTGTPLQNNLAELWSLLNFLLPEIFDDLAVFESWFDAKELQDDEATKKFLKFEEEKQVLATLREILQPFMLRREKADVCSDIPKKKEVIVYAPLTNLQHDLYAAVLSRDIDTLLHDDKDFNVDPRKLIIDSEDGTRPKRRCVLSVLQRETPYKVMGKDAQLGITYPNRDKILQIDKEEEDKRKTELSIWKRYANINDYNKQFLISIQMRNKLAMYKRIINHPYLVYCPVDAYGLPTKDEDFIKSSGKLLVLDAMLPKLKERGHRVLLFSTMRLVLDMVEDYLDYRNYSYTRLDGKTNLEDRVEYIQNFNADPDIFIFLISTRAGGVGINLASADTVIIYDSDWNPQVDLQAMARCHRIGQTRPVVIYRLCTKGTVDETIIARADAKRFLEKMVISKDVHSLMNNKEKLMELKQLLESKDCKIASSENEVFTDEELEELLDRSDMCESSTEA